MYALLHPNQINGERNYTNQDDHRVYRVLVPQACKLITNTYQILCRECQWCDNSVNLHLGVNLQFYHHYHRFGFFCNNKITNK